MRRRLGVLGFTLTAAIASSGGGCGDGSETSSQSSGSPTGTASTESGPGGAGGSGGGGSASTGEGGGIFGECKSGIICGSGDCCGSDDECVLGACLPTCASNVRCKDDLSVCCGTGEVCLGGACAAPTGTCLDWADCKENEFCDTALGTCLPQAPGAPVCEYKPPVGKLTPILEWSWTGSTIQPAHNQVINMPVVVDLEKNGTPDVVIVTSDNFDATGVGYLRALDGKDGGEKWDATVDVYKAANRVQPRGTPAAADIDGDGFVEIVALKAGGGLIAFEHDGTLKWVSKQKDGVTPWTTGLASGTVVIADLEGDGTAEIVVGGVIFESTGVLRVDGGAFFGANVMNYGAVSIIADLDGALPQEIVSGKRAIHADGTTLWDNALADGYPAIADFDMDGKPELVVVANNTLRVHNAATGALIDQIAMPAAGAGGPPTIADFDKDGVPEIASANGGAYAVFEYDFTASPPKVTLKWQKATKDLSSNRTGSSVFDFQGDGAAEVVYNDECYFRVYNGKDGEVLYQEPNSSATIHEYPVVVDVDNDNNTEVVLVANDMSTGNGCPYGAAGARHGVFVYGDAGDNWVRTRKIWNQHAYHVTNINADGTLPAPEALSWIGPEGLNNYRQSSQGAGVFNAPDLQVSLEASLEPCPDKVRLRAFVQNKGSLSAPAGVSVTFYRGDSGAGEKIGTATTMMPLLPGEYEVVTVDYTLTPGETAMSFYVEVDKDDQGNASLNECLEDNNAASLGGVQCSGAN